MTNLFNKYKIPKNLNKELNTILMNKLNGSIHNKLLINIYILPKHNIYYGFRDISYNYLDNKLNKVLMQQLKEEFEE